MAAVQLGSKAEGSIIKLKENGALVDFYVAKQNYESGLNGAGRVLVVRKDGIPSPQWNSSCVNAYANSTLDVHLNGSYKNQLDANIRTAMGTTKFYYTPGNGNTTIGTLERSVFELSVMELGVDYRFANNEGTALAIASMLKPLYVNGAVSGQTTRSPIVGGGNTTQIVCVSSNGGIGSQSANVTWAARPVFTLPSTAIINDDGTVSTNTAPGTPSSITYPASINGGTDITVSWGAATDAESNLAGYIVERSTNGGTSWAQIYQGGALSTVNNVAFGTATVMYRVKAYDTEGLQSGWQVGGSVTVINNRAPSAPGSITVPTAVRGGAALAVSWTAAADSDGNLSGYELERSVSGGAWSQIYKGSALTYTDTITVGWVSVAYRVRAYDAYNAVSAYVTSAARTVDNNAKPVITSPTASGTNLGVKNEGFNLTYTVTDADSDKVTVKEYLDNVLQRTYTATLGQANTFQAAAPACYQRVLNGTHTLKVVANDGKVDSAAYTVSFSKAVTSAGITLEQPMEADGLIAVCVKSVSGFIPADAEYTVEVTNNAKDNTPVWEDCTAAVRAGINHVFANKTAANGFAFNFRLAVARGPSGIGGYITSVQGGFQ